MAIVRFALSGADIAALETVGLRLGGLRYTGGLAERSRIEFPTSIASPVPPDAFLDVGAFCSLGGASLNNARFGRYCSVASGATIGAHEHPTDWLTTSRTAYYPEVHGWDRVMLDDAAPEAQARVRPYLTSCPTTSFGPDVWVGQGAFVKAGVSIGAGAIVGARATVLRDVPPYAVVVGTPARAVRLRFPEPVVERLLTLEWWRYSIYDLFEAPFDDVGAALDRIEELVARGAVRPYQAPVVGPAELADPAALAAALTPAVMAQAS
jgi:acetyltransferase-like isoleucine patch superfamily enzyme